MVHNWKYKPHMVYLRSRLAVFIRQKRAGMSQRAFASRYGLAQSTVMRIENEDQNVTLNTLEQLCRVFRVDVGELFPRAPSAGDARRYGKPAIEPARLHEKRPEGSPVTPASKAVTRPRHGKGGAGSGGSEVP